MDPTAAGLSCLHVDVFPAAEVSTPATGTKTALFPRGLGGLLGTPPFFAVNLPALGPISGPAALRERKRLQGKDKDGVSGDLRRETAQGLTQLLTKGSPFDHLPCTTLRHFPPGTRAQVSLGSPNQQLDRRHQPTAQQNPKPKGKRPQETFPETDMQRAKSTGRHVPRIPHEERHARQRDSAGPTHLSLKGHH